MSPTGFWGRGERSLTIFISSPKDVADERAQVGSVVEEVNRTVGQKIGLFLRTRAWERFRPRGENIMTFIERQMKESDLLLMLFHRRFGSSPSEDTTYTSGTEQEYEIARRLQDSGTSGRPEIFTYFRDIQDQWSLDDPGPELKKVLDFKERVKDSLFYRSYSSPETFPIQLKDHLIEWLLEMSEVISRDDYLARKARVLGEFFSLGLGTATDDSAKIVYPPVATEYKDIGSLLPLLVVEDFQAIHKLTKCLHIAGCSEIRANTTDFFDLGVEAHHRTIFICLSRNLPGKRALSEISDLRFRLDRPDDSDKDRRRIIWKARDGSEVRVRSPQTLYLQEQRERTGDQWMTEPGKVSAVDFAVLARFSGPLTSSAGLGSRNIVFAFGLRGLGTWGAAWYLDCKFEELPTDLGGRSDFQALLKVSFSKYHIDDVEDVSDRPQEFFDRENDLEYVRTRLAGMGP